MADIGAADFTGAPRVTVTQEFIGSGDSRTSVYDIGITPVRTGSRRAIIKSINSELQGVPLSTELVNEADRQRYVSKYPSLGSSKSFELGSTQLVPTGYYHLNKDEYSTGDILYTHKGSTKGLASGSWRGTIVFDTLPVGTAKSRTVFAVSCQYQNGGKSYYGFTQFPVTQNFRDQAYAARGGTYPYGRIAVAQGTTPETSKRVSYARKLDVLIHPDPVRVFIAVNVTAPTPDNPGRPVSVKVERVDCVPLSEIQNSPSGGFSTPHANTLMMDVSQEASCRYQSYQDSAGGTSVAGGWAEERMWVYATRGRIPSFVIENPDITVRGSSSGTAWIHSYIPSRLVGNSETVTLPTDRLTNWGVARNLYEPLSMGNVILARAGASSGTFTVNRTSESGRKTYDILSGNSPRMSYRDVYTMDLDTVTNTLGAAAQSAISVRGDFSLSADGHADLGVWDHIFVVPTFAPASEHVPAGSLLTSLTFFYKMGVYIRAIGNDGYEHAYDWETATELSPHVNGPHPFDLSLLTGPYSPQYDTSTPISSKYTLAQVKFSEDYDYSHDAPASRNVIDSEGLQAAIADPNRARSTVVTSSCAARLLEQASVPPSIVNTFTDPVGQVQSGESSPVSPATLTASPEFTKFSMSRELGDRIAQKAQERGVDIITLATTMNTKIETAGVN